jgi:predicted phosphodiesterase
MARFLFWSDLHLEFSGAALPPHPAGMLDDAPDAILIAGDLATAGNHVDALLHIWDAWRVPVLMVPGNHEYYGKHRFQKLVSTERERIAEIRAAGADIDVLRCGVREIGDTRVLGATLWTGFDLMGVDRREIAMGIAADRMNDYRKIQWHDERRGIYRKMIPSDTLQMHREEKAWLLETLAQPYHGRTVVMTHHTPVEQQVREGRNYFESSAYASDMWPQIGNHKVDAWISGHTHDNVECVLEGAHGPVSFLSNACGYPDQETGFDPFRVLDSNAPQPAVAIESDRLDL